LTAPRFRRAVDALIERGFIDVAASGAGYRRLATLYAISDRWQAWGTPDFKRARRPRTANPGFQRGNSLWRKRKQKKAK